MYYRALSSALRAQFGGKVYKLALDGRMTCPNRDGTLGTRGCLFCNGSGSGSFAAAPCADIREQLEAGKALVRRKYSGDHFIAYFQNFTNTYAPVARLRSLFTAAMEPDDIVALSVATRPDCLPDEVLALLAELNEKKPVWVELGLQTVHPATAALIRRGYPLSCYDAAVRRLKATGITVITHMILGLPGETAKQITETARYIGESGADGIKLQLLHVLKGTDLETLYRSGGYTPLSLPEYIALLEDCLRVLPPDMVIHRLTGDGAKAELVAPLWSADKKRVLNALGQAFRRDRVLQGEWLLYGAPRTVIEAE